MGNEGAESLSAGHALQGLAPTGALDAADVVDGYEWLDSSGAINAEDS